MSAKVYAVCLPGRPLSPEQGPLRCGTSGDGYIYPTLVLFPNGSNPVVFVGTPYVGCTRGFQDLDMEVDLTGFKAPGFINQKLNSGHRFGSGYLKHCIIPEELVQALLNHDQSRVAELNEYALRTASAPARESTHEVTVTNLSETSLVDRLMLVDPTRSKSFLLEIDQLSNPYVMFGDFDENTKIREVILEEMKVRYAESDHTRHECGMFFQHAAALANIRLRGKEERYKELLQQEAGVAATL